MVVTRNVTYTVGFTRGSAVPSTDQFVKLEWASPPTGNVLEIEPALGVERLRPPGGKWDWSMKFLQSGEFSMRFFIRGGGIFRILNTDHFGAVTTKLVNYFLLEPLLKYACG